MLESCPISAEDLDFGTYDPNRLLPTLGVSTITATCAQLTTFDIGLDAGSGDSAAKDLELTSSDGGETLDDSLSCAGAGMPRCAPNWGHTPGTDTFDGIGAGSATPTAVTSTIVSGRQVTPNTYCDHPVTVTVCF